MKVELSPQLGHCIETVARERYALLARHLLEAERPDPAAEEELEILRLFLEKANFRRLRAESEPHLAAGRKVSFTVYLSGGRPAWTMSVTQAPG